MILRRRRRKLHTMRRIFNLRPLPWLVPRDPRTIARLVHEALEIPVEEAELYISTLIGGGYSPEDVGGRAMAEALSARGMLILDAKGRSYLAVHPRMAISNLFRAYEERMV